ncbi:MAG: DNA-directed RNA polymerase subunit H [Thermoplasmata archaeon]|nr:DNA-directed RNA polymerase subunit H [Thermoplasmata archaeon]
MTPTSSKRPRRARGKKSAEPPKVERPFVAHLLVPPHELLSEAETKEVLATLGSTIERLPKIYLSDPGLKTDPKFRAAREAREPLKGRLIRVRRPSPTAGAAVAYRVLISTTGD